MKHKYKERYDLLDGDKASMEEHVVSLGIKVEHFS